ncbi:MAG: PRC-barrel domain-containing protein, partial [Anaerolineae bacterium]|nr:PRC-barrel domain-containing protein [Anaerolineae bacterium]
MVNGKELSNRLLISMTDGSKVGEIKDIYLDQNAQVLTAVFIAKEGLLGRKKLVLPRTAIQVLGKDAWLVGDSDS